MIFALQAGLDFRPRFWRPGMHQQLTQALIQAKVEDLSRHPRFRPVRSGRSGARSAISTAWKSFSVPLATRLIPAR